MAGGRAFSQHAVGVVFTCLQQRRERERGTKQMLPLTRPSARGCSVTRGNGGRTRQSERPLNWKRMCSTKLSDTSSSNILTQQTWVCGVFTVSEDVSPGGTFTPRDCAESLASELEILCPLRHYLRASADAILFVYVCVCVRVSFNQTLSQSSL
ncbi:hypothetical protein WMY93_017882 [Mugilogobius chulae]|uniref:Uncharacterized protein n=1 Tax=Mugilogobius chulae TaxID=88201 RepID=A0AAW0NIF8_9GOBI